eukprot:scaffold346_cov116-Cylindrotheca_fusiformis.AAC.30
MKIPFLTRSLPSFLNTSAALVVITLVSITSVEGFLSSSFPVGSSISTLQAESLVVLNMAQANQKEAEKGIEKVVSALRRDSAANSELGRLDQVTTILGYGNPTPGSLAVRFNASFKKSGFGLAAVPLPFGLGQSEKSEGRGQMVGQVKASIDSKTGRITSCSVFRDLGYGRAFNLKL